MGEGFVSAIRQTFSTMAVPVVALALSLHHGLAWPFLSSGVTPQVLFQGLPRAFVIDVWGDYPPDCQNDCRRDYQTDIKMK